MRNLALSVPNPNITGDPLQIKTPPGVPDLGFTSGVSVIQLVFSFVFMIGIVLTLAMIIYSGIQWITSGGDPKAIEGAKNRLTYSIIGLIVILASFLIVSAVIQIIGGNPSFFLPQS